MSKDISSTLGELICGYFFFFFAGQMELIGRADDLKIPKDSQERRGVAIAFGSLIA